MTELNAEPRYGLLGATLNGPPPLGLVHLPLRTGLTALYGKNGVGKTKILQALECALDGTKGSGKAWLHCRLSPKDIVSNGWVNGDMDDPITEYIRRELKSEVMAVDVVGALEFGVALPNRRTASVQQLAKKVTEREIGGEATTSLIIEELVNQGFVSLRPVGTRAAARWEVVLSAHPDEDSPLVTRLVTNAVGLIQTMNDVDSSLTTEAKQHFIGQLIEELDDDQVLAWHFLGDIVTAGYPDRPIWAPIPLDIKLCTIELPWGFRASLDSDEALTDRCFDHVRRTCKTVVEAMLDGEMSLSDEADALLQRLGNTASSKLSQVLGMDSPSVRCRVLPWGERRPLQWEALDTLSGEWLPLNDLGSGRSRWAVVASHLALDQDETFNDPLDPRPEFDVWPGWRGSVVVIDEPEAGLHPAAQQQAFNGLLNWSTGISLVVATHSGSAFSNPSITLTHVHRAEGQTVASGMDPVIADLLHGEGIAELGLNPSDVLQTIRTFLIVEGEHDRAVLGELIGMDEQVKARLRIAPVRGARHLGSVLNARLILDFTEANVVVALDRTDGARATSCWEQARELLKRGEKQKALLTIRAIGQGGSEEETLLAEFCRASVERGLIDRVHVFGFTKPDIIEYLPVRKFIRHAPSWDPVVAEWRDHPGRLRFKDWLRDVKRVNISPDKLSEIASEMDTADMQAIATELAALTELCARGATSSI